MKTPKHRTTIYVIVREDFYRTTALDSFRTYERAEEVKGIYEKETPQFDFKIMASTYYDE